jgi:hypothetical protein
MSQPLFKADLEKLAVKFSCLCVKPDEKEVAKTVRNHFYYLTEAEINKAISYVVKRLAEKSRPKVEKTKQNFQRSIAMHSDGLKSMPYKDFLYSPYWKAFSSERKVVSGNKCESCNSSDKLEVHHLDYKHRGSDHLFLDFTIVLCSSCHKRRHKLDF